MREERAAAFNATAGSRSKAAMEVFRKEQEASERERRELLRRQEEVREAEDRM